MKKSLDVIKLNPNNPDEQISYHSVDYCGKSYTLKVIWTDHCINRSASRTVPFEKIVDLLQQGIRYIIDTANINFYINSSRWKRYTKLISSLNSFYLISQCLWKDDKYSSSFDKGDKAYDIEVVLVTVALDLFKSYRVSRSCRARNKSDTFSFNV